jgi:5-methylcytosine-specific restriction protein A
MPIRAPLFRPAGQRTKAQRKADADRNRGTSAQRGYDAVWRRLRRMHLNSNPLCVFHWRLGVPVVATVVDHIESIQEAPERRLDPTNLQSLCKPCHDKVRQREQAAERRP